MNLFCFPYAGASSYRYLQWKKYFDPSIRICPVELSGRGKRISEPLYNSIEEAVEDIFWQISDKLDEAPYALFGHSMGSLLIYELAYRIHQKGLRLPDHLIFSGRLPPHLHALYDHISDLPMDEFYASLSQYGGPLISQDEEYAGVFLPIVHSDFRMLDRYTFVDRSEGIHSEISVFYGTNDNAELNGKMVEWKYHTDKACNIYPFSGGHFFIFDDMRKTANTIKEILIY